MAIKQLIKKIGKTFIVLKEEGSLPLKQTILIVDNGYSGLEYLFSCIDRINNYFPQAEVLVLTFEHRKAEIEKEFHNLRFIIASRQIDLKRYRIALQMLKICRKKIDFILLLSLDISPLIASLFFANCRIVLYNQWGQWWSIRLRKISELFKVTYANKIKKFSFKSLLKKIGLFFVLLQQEGAGIFKHSVLIVDNGYASYEQLHCAVQRTAESLPQAKITVLTSGERKELKDRFPALELIAPKDFIFKRYKIVNAMLSLHDRYNYVILLSLDITPILASFLCLRKRALLYNKWHQWWSLTAGSIKSCIMVIPRFIYNIIVFIYLIISVALIFLIKTLNVFRFSLLKKEI
jgi:hypothetical protein